MLCVQGQALSLELVHCHCWGWAGSSLQPAGTASFECGSTAALRPLLQRQCTMATPQTLLPCTDLLVEPWWAGEGSRFVGLQPATACGHCWCSYGASTVCRRLGRCPGKDRSALVGMCN